MINLFIELIINYIIQRNCERHKSNSESAYLKKYETCNDYEFYMTFQLNFNYGQVCTLRLNII